MIVSREALHRWIDSATAVRIWIVWSGEASGAWLPVDKATARRMVDSADGTFEVETNGLGVLFIVHHTD